MRNNIKGVIKKNALKVFVLFFAKIFPFLGIGEIGYEVYKIYETNKVLSIDTTIEYAKNYILDTKMHIRNDITCIEITERLKRMGMKEVNEDMVKQIVEDLRYKS